MGLWPIFLHAFCWLFWPSRLWKRTRRNYTVDQRVEILRGLTSEYATVKVPLPRSKKPLDVKTDGSYDKQEWTDIGKQLGPAGRIGDLVQVTHVEIEKDSIILQINGGMRAKGGWKDHVSIGMGGATNPINGGQPTNAPGGTTIALRFGEPIGGCDVRGDQENACAGPRFQSAERDAAVYGNDSAGSEEGDRGQESDGGNGSRSGGDGDRETGAKSRETKEGIEYEDWVYGNPPGRMTFVTFGGAKVVKVKETYAGLGGTVAETPRPQ